MALLNTKNNYIKLDVNGTVEVYKSKLDRDKFKKAADLSIEDIIKTYEQVFTEKHKNFVKICAEKNISRDLSLDQLIQEIKADNELLILWQDLNNLRNEYLNYKQLLVRKRGNYLKEPFIYMSKVFPKIELTIKNLVNSYSINLDFEEIDLNLDDNIKLERIYLKAKQLGIFGDTVDC